MKQKFLSSIMLMILFFCTDQHMYGMAALERIGAASVDDIAKSLVTRISGLTEDVAKALIKSSDNLLGDMAKTLERGGVSFESKALADTMADAMASAVKSTGKSTEELMGLSKTNFSGFTSTFSKKVKGTAWVDDLLKAEKIESGQAARMKKSIEFSNGALSDISKIGNSAKRSSNVLKSVEAKTASVEAKTASVEAKTASVEAKTAAAELGAAGEVVEEANLSVSQIAKDQKRLKPSEITTLRGEGKGTYIDKARSRAGIYKKIDSDFVPKKEIGGTFKSLKTFSKTEARLSELDQELLHELRAKVKNKSLSASERKAFAHQLAELEFQQSHFLVRGAKSFGGLFTAKNLGMTLLGAAGTLYMAVLFMVPSLMQSSYLAQQQKNALLQTYLPPVKFGNVVMQLPDSVVNMGNPLSSQFVYYGIPVDNPGDDISAQAAAQYPGVSGPTDKNALSKHVDNEFARTLNWGQKKIHVKRYNLDAQALASLPIYVSYSDQSWAEWGTNGIPDAAFSQMMVNLNTGAVLYADGSLGKTPAPLVGENSNAKTIQSFLKTKGGQLKTAGLQHSFTEFENYTATSKSGDVQSPIIDQFDCGCLVDQNPDGLLSGDVVQTCSAHGTKKCLLTAALNQIAAGLVLNADGQELRPDQNLADELAKGALGQITPIQGYGDKFDALLAMFPGAQQNALANSGVLTVSLGAATDEDAVPKIQGADPDNYAAKGIYIYQCQNTPLAKMLRAQAGGAAAYSSVITDFIVFLDINLNQVPLMVPVIDPKNYHFARMGLNPAIKYVSTILGSADGNGGFSFLPQAYIQTPASLVAKGLPATFAPLYGLNALKGSLSVNYNKNLSSVIGGIVQALNNNPKLGQQFQALQGAMLRLLESGPFGKYRLTPLDDTLQPVIAGVKLALYKGYKAYPAPQDSSDDCSDILIPLSAQGKTISLPSNAVAQYYGLVTDLTYTVAADGSLLVGKDGFKHSILQQVADNTGNGVSWFIKQDTVDQYYWMSLLTNKGQQADPNFQMPDDLVNMVQNNRQAWVAWVQSTNASSLKNQEFSGVTLPGTSNVLTVVSQQALVNGLYIYTCKPNPSTLAQDFFVLINTSSTTENNATLGTLSASSAKAQTNMLSIVSGVVYNAEGKVISTQALDGKQIIQSLYARNPNGFTDEFIQELNLAYNDAASSENNMLYPFNFADLRLGIYQSDVNAGNFLYFDAGGAGTTTDFKPADYFVTIDSYKNPAKVGQQLAASTQYMVSLVSGQVYDQQGVVTTLGGQVVAAIISKLSPAWQDGVLATVQQLIAAYQATVAQQQQVTEQMNAAANAAPSTVTWPQSAVVACIKGLSQAQFLPTPFDMIKQDTKTGNYVIVSPADQEKTQFVYTFLDVPHTFVDDQNKPVATGAMYDEQGNLLRVIQGFELITIANQYGIVVKGVHGKQLLGVPTISGLMALDAADKGLQPGASGKFMIHANNAQFPALGITSPIAYQDSKFYMYYNLMTHNYYVMQIQGSTARYIDLVAGNVYDLNGYPQVGMYPVAFNTQSDATDVFLPYHNQDNYLRGILKNQSGLYVDCLNLTDSFQAYVQDPMSGQTAALNQLATLDGSQVVSMAQMPFPDNISALPDVSVATDYALYADDSGNGVVYTVNPAYQWHKLEYLPIDTKTGSIVAQLKDAALYGTAGVVMKNGALQAAVFANTLYTGVKTQGQNNYILSAGNASVQVTFQQDAQTGMPYVAFVAGGTTYVYQYAYNFLSADVFQDYLNNGLQGQQVVDVTGKVIFEKNIPTDQAGNVQLVRINAQSFVNPADVGNMIKTLTDTIVQDPSTGRFFVAAPAGTYTYITQDCFVDLEDGLLFDMNGNVLPATIQISDLVAILQKMSVYVVRHKTTQQTALQYYQPKTAPVAKAGQAADSSKVQTPVTGRLGSSDKKAAHRRKADKHKSK